jgi:hypothetical protein
MYLHPIPAADPPDLPTAIDPAAMPEDLTALDPINLLCRAETVTTLPTTTLPTSPYTGRLVRHWHEVSA